ncbi:MAG TPA: DVUA0089 family protein [Kofleriaceae bacterium]
MLRLVAAVAVVLASGCLADKGFESDLPEDGKADTQRRPTDHGLIGFGTPAASELTGAARYHAWTFELSADARVELTTSYAVLGQRRTDTVLYLYKEGATGWGSYIARNDDYGNTTYSQLVKQLGAGRYRALVKGYSETTYGKFKLTAMCNGAGCSSTSCAFGQTYGEIADNPALQIVNHRVITPADLPMLNDQERAWLVLAVQQSAHTDVTTPQEAIARVDQQEINLVYIVEPAAQRMFVAFEYGAGDNSYGAIFSRTDGSMVTNIHDGDLEHCTVKAETCLLSDDWSAMRMDPAFTRTSTRVITAASQLTALEQTQALDTFKRSYPDVTSVSEGLALADGNQLEIVSFTHTSGAHVTVFEHGAGDTSVGVIFYAGELRHAATIDDLAIGNCTLFAH